MKNIDEIKFKEGLRHQAGMTVPDNFFATFQANLEKEIDKLEAQKQQSKPVELRIEPKAEQPRIGLWTRVASIAACVVVLVGVGLFAFNLDSETPAAPELTAENAEEGEYNETDRLILSSFDDLYLYDLYCDASN